MSVLKILFVCSGNNPIIPVFIEQQKKELEKRGYQIDYFTIKGKGMIGYLKNLPSFFKLVVRARYDLIHGHYGLSGFFSCLQLKTPVIVSFYGSDINNPEVCYISQLANVISKRSIAVSASLKAVLPFRNKTELIPCGVNKSIFRPYDKAKSRELLQATGKFNFTEGKYYILFSSSFDRPVKNPQLAYEAIAILGNDYELIELKGYSQMDVVLLLNAADALLLTSVSEGSPQVIKEAMLTCRPIVSTNVGDIRRIISGTHGCYISEATPHELAINLAKAVQVPATNGKDMLSPEYYITESTNRIIATYHHVLQKK